jgi:hypothetical protein
MPKVQLYPRTVHKHFDPTRAKFQTTNFKQRRRGGYSFMNAELSLESKIQRIVEEMKLQECERH